MPQKRRVTAVVFRDAQTGREERIACRAVVLAAGAINTPASAAAVARARIFRDGLGNTHGVLGRYLNDHPIGKLVLDLGSPIRVTRQRTSRAPRSIARPRCTPRPACSGAAPRSSRAACSTGIPGGQRSTGFSVFGTMAPEPRQLASRSTRAAGREGGTPGLTLHIRHPPEAATRYSKKRAIRSSRLLHASRLRARVSSLEDRIGGQFQPLRRHLSHARIARVRHG